MKLELELPWDLCDELMRIVTDLYQNYPGYTTGNEPQVLVDLADPGLVMVAFPSTTGDIWSRGWVALWSDGIAIRGEASERYVFSSLALIPPNRVRTKKQGITLLFQDSPDEDGAIMVKAKVTGEDKGTSSLYSVFVDEDEDSVYRLAIEGEDFQELDKVETESAFALLARFMETRVSRHPRYFCTELNRDDPPVCVAGNGPAALSMESGPSLRTIGHLALEINPALSFILQSMTNVFWRADPEAGEMYLCTADGDHVVALPLSDLTLNTSQIQGHFNEKLFEFQLSVDNRKTLREAARDPVTKTKGCALISKDVNTRVGLQPVLTLVITAPDSKSNVYRGLEGHVLLQGFTLVFDLDIFQSRFSGPEFTTVTGFRGVKGTMLKVEGPGVIGYQSGMAYKV